MAAECEYKQRCDNQAILNAMKAPSCEMRTHWGHMHLFPGQSLSHCTQAPTQQAAPSTTASAISDLRDCLDVIVSDL